MEWISVKDRLPELYEWVFVAVESVCGKKWFATAYRSKTSENYDWYWWGVGYPTKIKEVTHWIPL